MKTLDSASSFFWLLVSLVTLRESYRLGLGSVHNPGTGFLTFWAAAILGTLSLVLFLMAFLKKEAATRAPIFKGTGWKRVLFVLAVLVIYAVLMPVLGYLISTFLLMSLLFWVLEKKRFGVVLLSAFLTTFVTYLVFSKWLNCQFPEGLFGL